MQDHAIWIILAVIVLISIVRDANARKRAKMLATSRSRFLRGEGAGTWVEFVGRDRSCLAQSREGRTWVFRPGEVQGIALDYDVLLGAEVLEDESSVTQAHRGRQIGGAMIGSAIAGSAGMIIGALGSKQRSRRNVSKLVLRLTMDNHHSPIVDIPFMKSRSRGLDVRNPAYQKRAQAAAEWCGRMEMAMRQHSGPEVEAAPQPDPSRGRAEELQRWVSMKDDGHITEAEYQTQKNRILSL